METTLKANWNCWCPLKLFDEEKKNEPRYSIRIFFFWTASLSIETMWNLNSNPQFTMETIYSHHQKIIIIPITRSHTQSFLGLFTKWKMCQIILFKFDLTVICRMHVPVKIKSGSTNYTQMSTYDLFFFFNKLFSFVN